MEFCSKTSFQKFIWRRNLFKLAQNISLIKEYNDYVILGVKTRFFRDWITSRYADKILSELKKHKLSINRIEFKIEPENKSSQNSLNGSRK